MENKKITKLQNTKMKITQTTTLNVMLCDLLRMILEKTKMKIMQMQNVKYEHFKYDYMMKLLHGYARSMIISIMS